MPELNFKGKEFVYNHHLTVPFRPLLPQADKGIGTPALDGNLIIHGDNLHGLKALLPTHAGKVDCIFIDPPYNTGNEGWCYNDNVNSPMIKEWLRDNPAGQRARERIAATRTRWNGSSPGSGARPFERQERHQACA